MPQLIVLLCCLITVEVLANDHREKIKPQQVLADVSYLAADELQGRGVFSTVIDQAADFISSRYREIGLVPLDGFSDFKQDFGLYHVMPEHVSLMLDGVRIDAANIAVATSRQQLIWNDINRLSQTVITEKDDFNQQIDKINRAGSRQLVLVHPSHQWVFEQYQAHFAKGINHLQVDTEHSLVMVLSEQTAAREISLTVNSEVKRRKLTNVVGVLPGTSSEVILFSAHYDHLGMRKQSDQQHIFNGANDNASGTAAIINLAQYYKTRSTAQRTLVFAAFTAEEIGGYGSQHFASIIDSDMVKAMINIEMIGKPSQFGEADLWMTGFEYSNLAQLINDALADNNRKIHPDPYPKQRLFYRSDNASLARLGVPAHSFSSTQLDRDEHYHRVTDDLHRLNIESMTQMIESLAIGCEPLVEGKVTPTRLDKSRIIKKGLIF